MKLHLEVNVKKLTHNIFLETSFMWDNSEGNKSKRNFSVQRFSLAEAFRRNVKLLTGVIGQVTHPK